MSNSFEGTASKIYPRIVQPAPASSEVRGISQIIGECAGAVSVCWVDIAQAGVFDSTQAAKHVEDAVAEITALIEGASK